MVSKCIVKMLAGPGIRNRNLGETARLLGEPRPRPQFGGERSRASASTVCLLRRNIAAVMLPSIHAAIHAAAFDCFLSF